MDKNKNLTWDDVDIRKFRQIREAIMEEQAAEDETAELISIMFDVALDEVYEMKLNEFAEKAKQLKFLDERPQPNDIKETYHLGTTDYIICPLKVFTYQQYFQYQLVIQSEKRDYIDILSLILMPKGKKYGEYDIDDVRKDLLSMKITDALAIDFFFLLSFRILTETFKSYAEKMERKTRRMEKMEQLKKKLKGRIFTNG